jgi:hypothetical protein
MENKKLIESMDSLRSSIDRSNSWKWAIFLGIARGVGVVLGATVIAGLLLGWAAATFDQVSEIPYIGQFFGQMENVLDTPVE